MLKEIISTKIPFIGKFLDKINTLKEICERLTTIEVKIDKLLAKKEKQDKPKGSKP